MQGNKEKFLYLLNRKLTEILLKQALRTECTLTRTEVCWLCRPSSAQGSGFTRPYVLEQEISPIIYSKTSPSGRNTHSRDR